jgi:hypothetical protein
MPLILSSILATFTGLLIVLLTSPTINNLYYNIQSLSILSCHALLADIFFALLCAFLILCHVESTWVARNQSFPYAYHLSWNFGPKAFNFQLLIFEVFHIHAFSRRLHMVNMVFEELFWLCIFHGTFGIVGLLIINTVLTAQALSYRDLRLGIVVLLTNLTLSVATYFAFDRFADRVNLLDISKVALFWLVVLRTASHVTEPVPPSYDSEVLVFDSGFGDIGFAHLKQYPLHALWLFVLGIVSELGAGMPGRLFNVVLYKAMHRCGGCRYSRLMSVEEGKTRAGEVIVGGWGANGLTKEMYRWALPIDVEKHVGPCDHDRGRCVVWLG